MKEGEDESMFVEIPSTSKAFTESSEPRCDTPEMPPRSTQRRGTKRKHEVDDDVQETLSDLANKQADALKVFYIYRA